MKAPVLRLLDFGDGREFEPEVSTITSVVQAMSSFFEHSDRDRTYRAASPAALVESVHTSSGPIFVAALRSEAYAVHIASHVSGWGKDLLPSFDREAEYLLLSDITAALYRDKHPFAAHALIVDGCDSARRKFTAEVRNWLSHDIAYVGTTRSITSADSALFGSAFYGRLLQRRGAGVDPVARVLEAAKSAIEIHRQVTGRSSAYSAQVLTPSRQSREAFRHP